MTEFKKWTSINKFSDIYHLAQKLMMGEIKMSSKVKLHGTNSAIRVQNGALVGQKRSGDVRVGADNAGFASWLDTVTYLGGEFEGVIFDGEWAGPGVQQGDAVASLPEKMFFVFAIRMPDGSGVVNPEDISIMTAKAFGSNNRIKVLPWHTHDVVDMGNSKNCEEFMTRAVAEVDAIGARDPYIYQHFGIEGEGEGLVYYIHDMGEYWTDWLFKVKTEAHTVNKSRIRGHVAPEKPEGVDEFVEMFFTDVRFNQMLDEHLEGKADKKETGTFLKHVMSDVAKESVNELELADFDWKTVTKFGVIATKRWFLTKSEES
jgi:hypothetical protein